MEDEEAVSSHSRRQNFMPLTMGKECSKAIPVAEQVVRENCLRHTSRIPKSHGSSEELSESLGETKVLPLIAALIFVLAALGMGLFDRFFPTAEGANPKKAHSPIQEVNKSSITVTHPGIGFPEMVFTRHKVGKNETISRIAYLHGISPTTIVSVNALENTGIPEEGRSLMIPYVDGWRIRHLEGESIREAAIRFNIAIDRIQQIPGSEDYFVYGQIPDAVSASKIAGDHFLYPVPGRILTAYGESVDDLTGISYTSEGIGISVKSGTPVCSSKEGRVILTGHHSAYGLYVIMSHAGKWKSFYGHLGSIQVSIGDKLDTGELLGYSGATGTVSGPQLLFVLVFAGKSVDPLNHLY